jgi:NAD(P)H-dependent FMN reductase
MPALDRRTTSPPIDPETEAMTASSNLYLPVLLGTTRRGRSSELAAKAVHRQVATWPGVATDLIDIARIPMPTDDAGEAIKDPGFSDQMTRADGLVVVSPEYNHGSPGLLKHVLDSCLKEYIHKAVGIVGVSAGPWGGARGIQGLLPVMRELGLVCIFWDVHFAHVHRAFDDQGNLTDRSQADRIDKFLAELVWMARTLRHGRENVALETR